MRKTNMRSGFTMIELIFVIVVLGILASVAMPKFVNVQDDAKVSSEKSTIGAVRSAIGMLHGKAIIKNGDFTVKFTAPSKKSQTIRMQVTDELYPVVLSATDSSTDSDLSKALGSGESIVGDGGTATATDFNYALSAVTSDGKTDWATGGANGAATLAAVLDLDGRTDWISGNLYVDSSSTTSGSKGSYTSGDTYAKQLMEGPASYKTGVKDDTTVDEFEIDSDGGWQYDAITGTIVYRKTDIDLTASTEPEPN